MNGNKFEFPEPLPEGELGVVYGRISKDKRTAADEVQGSMDKQEDGCFDYAKFKKIVIAAAFADPDVSGARSFRKRVGGQELTDFIVLRMDSERPIKHLIVYAPDRLGRDEWDVVGMVREWSRRGITLHIVDMGGDTFTKDPTGRLMLGIRLLMAQWERENTCARYQATADFKLKKGERICNRVFGWDYKPTGRFVVKNDGERREIKELVDNPGEQQWIRYMKQRRVEGASYTGIAKELNELGITTKSGGKWKDSRVWKLINSRHVKEKLPKAPKPEIGEQL